MSLVDVLCNTCDVCGNASVLTVDRDSLARWQSGEMAQRAFPDLDADQRELLISGTHAHCWETLFGGME